MGGLRRAAVGIALGACAWAAVPAMVQAATTTTTTVPSLSMPFSGTAADGTALTLTAHISDVTLSRLSLVDPTANAGPGSDFLSLDTSTDLTTGTGPTFSGVTGVAEEDIKVALPDGNVVTAEPPGPQLDFLRGELAFVVPASTRSATLEIAPGTLNAFENPGAVATDVTFTTITFQPTTLQLVVPPPFASVPATATTEPPVRQPQPEAHRPVPAQRHTTAKRFTPAETVGAGTGGGIVVLILLIPIWRRRAYRKADSEGRVMIDSPPVLTVPPVRPADAEHTGTAPLAAPSGGPVVVKVLGPVEVDGLVHPFGGSPEQEVLVFLALHPGRRFTSIELRSRIWIEGRDEPAAATFRNYLVGLRKCLPQGTVVRTGLNYALTDAVTSDWDQFCGLLAHSGDQAEHLAEALALVRGSPFEGAFSGRNGSYGWAGDLSHQIEVAVEIAGHELATLGLESGDLALADAGVGQVLRCLPASVVARGDHLRLGAALGGPREVERRMRAARQALGADAVVLEPLASSIGWVKA